MLQGDVVGIYTGSGPRLLNKKQIFSLVVVTVGKVAGIYTALVRGIYTDQGA